MNSTPKTIQIFLPDGDPRGIRVAEITTRIVKVIEVPRSLLQDFLKMPESGEVALYFLFGEGEDSSGPKVYIGQTGDLRARLVTHNKEKEFWERALVLISRTQNMTGTHTLFLEWHCLQVAKAAGRYVNENGNGGSKPHIPPPMAAECMEIFETGQTLLATLGYPVFDPVRKPTDSSDSDEVFYCTSAGIAGRGLYTSEGFVVLQGSVGRKDSMPHVLGTSTEASRNKLLQAGVTRADGDTIVFQKDHLFTSPSLAAMSLLGRASNGWQEWKTKDGRTLDVVKRQSVRSSEETMIKS